MDAAVRGLIVPAAVNNAGVNEKAFASMNDVLLASAPKKQGTFCNDNGLQFFMPMPRNLIDAQIIIIAGNWKIGCSMFDQFLTMAVNCDVAGGYRHRYAPLAG